MAAAPEPRMPLSRDRILRTAVELADEQGVEALTMRGLGRQLGFEAMSLYNHVGGKDDLLDGMLDLVLDETEPPSAGDDWVEGVRSSAVSVHHALRRHPWAAGLLMSAARLRPSRLRYMDSLLGSLREAGFDADTTFHAYHVLDGHIFGFSLWLTAHEYTDQEASEIAASVGPVIASGEFPHLNEHAQQHFAAGPNQEVSAFELGLDLILDGLRRKRGGES